MYMVDAKRDPWVITEVGWVDEQKQSNQKIPGSVRHTKEFETNKMVEASVVGGFMLAEICKVLQQNFDDSPTDVYDGKCWWFYDTSRCLWRPDVSGTHIHQTIITSVKRDYGYLKHAVGSKPMVTEPIDRLIANINQEPFRRKLVSDCRATFLDREFLLRLNTKPHLIACSNGVFDINLGGVTPRVAYRLHHPLHKPPLHRARL